MIIGILAIVALIVIRFSGETSAVDLPDEIMLPDGAMATAFTQGEGWYAVVTEGQEILIFDGTTQELRQRIKIAP